MWTVWTTGSSTAASASIERLRKAAGEVLTAKQAPHRPGTAPALGLRAGNDVPHSIADQPRKGELTMSFNSWLQNLRSALAPGRGQRDHKRRGSLRAATHRPNLEGLEDRCVPSAYAVTDLGFSACDLNKAGQVVGQAAR